MGSRIQDKIGIRDEFHRIVSMIGMNVSSMIIWKLNEFSVVLNINNPDTWGIFVSLINCYTLLTILIRSRISRAWISCKLMQLHNFPTGVVWLPLLCIRAEFLWTTYKIGICSSNENVHFILHFFLS